MSKKTLTTAEILGIPLFSNSKEELLTELRGILESQRVSRLKLVFTPNPEIILAAAGDPEFKQALLNSEYNIPDGTGVVWASKVLALLGRSKGIAERITGADLMLELISEAGEHGWRVFLLGGRGSVAAEAAIRLKARFPKLVVRASSGPAQIERVSEAEDGRLIKEINSFRPDLLFVGFGQGKQEKWLTKHKDELKAKIAMGVGGSLDYYANRLARAPQLFQSLGIEWFFRLVQEPTRVGRITNATLKFPLEVIKSLFGAN